MISLGSFWFKFLCYYFVDNIFNEWAKARFPNEQDLAGFLGIFFAIQVPILQIYKIELDVFIYSILFSIGFISLISMMHNVLLTIQNKQTKDSRNEFRAALAL